MAHTKYTGYSGGTTGTYDGGSLPTGWRKITIEENGRPAPTPIDTTVSGDSAYQFTDDPLGGKGNPNATITFEGFLSVTDHQDSGMLSKTLGGTGTVLVTKKALGDKYTATAAKYLSSTIGAEVAGVAPFTFTFALAATTGTWSTAS